MKNMRLLLFLSLALVQIGVAGSMIVRREVTLRSGRQFRLRILPVNPMMPPGPSPSDQDGRRHSTLCSRQRARTGQTIYALISGDGEALPICAVSRKTPCRRLYFETGVVRTARQVHCELPFDRYYVAEEFRLLIQPDGKNEAGSEPRYDARPLRICRSRRLYLEGKPARGYLRGLQH
jgi:hypothetical protein